MMNKYSYNMEYNERNSSYIQLPKFDEPASGLLESIVKNHEQYMYAGNRYTFLGLAILKQDVILVNHLLQQEYNPNIICDLDNGFYPIERVIINIIIHANKLANYSILQTLLNAGGNVNLYSKEEPLLLSVYFRLYNIIDVLLSYKANPYTSIILCIYKLHDHNLNEIEVASWQKVKKLIFKHHYNNLFKSIESYLKRNYTRSLIKSQRLSNIENIIQSQLPADHLIDINNFSTDLQLLSSYKEHENFDSILWLAHEFNEISTNLEYPIGLEDNLEESQSSNTFSDERFYKHLIG